MIVRAYYPSPIPLSNLSVPEKRKRLAMERISVKKVEIQESLQTVTLYYTDGSSEMMNHNNYYLQIIKGEDNDGLSDGLALYD